MSSHIDQVESRPFVLLVHGVNSGGNWQKDVQRILNPHFHCERVKYNHYRWFCGSELIFEPFVLFPGLVVAMLFSWGVFEFANSPPMPFVQRTITSAVIVLVAAVVAFRFRRVRMNKAMMCVKRQISRRNLPGSRPHVVAHSLGTYLICRLLEKHPEMRLDNVVFTGCVVSPAFSWRPLVERDPSALLRLRNEVGQADAIVALAGRRESIARRLGNAGSVGFNISDGLVHTSSSLWGPCEQCELGGAAPIHNVIQREGDHASWDNGGHAYQFWLPTLLGIDPREFEHFLVACERSANAHHFRDRRELARWEAELKGPWGWADGRLDDIIHESIRSYDETGGQPERSTSTIVNSVITEIWQIVATAKFEAEHLTRAESTAVSNGSPIQVQNAIRALDPKYALARAVGVIMPPKRT